MFSLTAVTRTVALPNSRELPILKGIDLEASRGENLSVVGQSGSSKSTLLNIISMLGLPGSGAYTLNDTDISTLSDGKRATLRGDNLGFIFQQFDLFSSRTTLGNVEILLIYDQGEEFRNRTELAAAMLERIGLGDHLEATPSQLSGGEQQHVAIARALVRQPQLTLADKPIGMLDIDTDKIAVGLLKEVAMENNAALVVITHNLEVVKRSDRALKLRDDQLHADSVLLSTVNAMHSFKEAADNDERGSRIGVTTPLPLHSNASSWRSAGNVT